MQNLPLCIYKNHLSPSLIYLSYCNKYFIKISVRDDTYYVLFLPKCPCPRPNRCWLSELFKLISVIFCPTQSLVGRSAVLSSDSPPFDKLLTSRFSSWTIFLQAIRGRTKCLWHISGFHFGLGHNRLMPEQCKLINATEMKGKHWTEREGNSWSSLCLTINQPNDDFQLTLIAN